MPAERGIRPAQLGGSNCPSREQPAKVFLPSMHRSSAPPDRRALNRQERNHPSAGRLGRSRAICSGTDPWSGWNLLRELARSRVLPLQPDGSRASRDAESFVAEFERRLEAVSAKRRSATTNTFLDGREAARVGMQKLVRTGHKPFRRADM